MATSAPAPRFAGHPRPCPVDAPECVTRDRAPRAAKGGNSAAVPDCAVSPPTNRTLPRNRRADRIRHCTPAVPKCPSSSGAQNTATKGKAVRFLAPTKDPGAGGDRRSSFRLGCRSRLHGWIPMAVDGTSAPGAKIFPLPGFPRKRGPRPAFLARAPAAPKFVAPAGAQRCACPPLASGGLRLCFVFPAMNGSPSQRGTAPQDGERQCAISPNSPSSVGSEPSSR